MPSLPVTSRAAWAPATSIRSANVAHQESRVDEIRKETLRLGRCQAEEAPGLGKRQRQARHFGELGANACAQHRQAGIVRRDWR